MHKNTQERNLRETMNRKPTKVIAVCSGKGGVGKTNVATNLAIGLAAVGKDVCLLVPETCGSFLLRQAASL